MSNKKLELNFFALVCTFVLFFIIVCFLSKKVEIPSFSKDIINFNENWIINDGKNTFDDLEIKAYERNTFVNTIPNDFYGNCITFFSINSLVEVYLDNNLIYELKKDVNIGKSPGSLSNFVNLPKDCKGKQIKIILTSAYDRNSINIQDIIIGNYSDIVIDAFLSNLLPLIFNLAIFFIGIFLIIIFILFKGKVDDIFSIFYLGVTAIFFGLWSLSEIRILQVFLRSAILKYYICYLSLFLFPLAFLFYIKKENIFNNVVSKIVNKFILIHIIFIELLLFGHVIGFSDFTECLPCFHILLFLEVGIFAYFIGYLLIVKGKHVKISRNIFRYIIISLFVFFEIFEFVRYYKGTSDAALLSRLIIFAYLLFIFIKTFKKILNAVKLSNNAKKYREIAYVDSLTGLKSRTAFEEKKLDLANDKVAIVYLDVNYLKYFNDTFGHEKGDELLVTCAKLIQETFNSYCYRIGGDEFVVLLPNHEYADAKNLVKILQSKIDTFNEINKDIFIEIAYGILFKNNVDKFKDALHLADELMYKNKKIVKKNSKFLEIVNKTKIIQ